MEKRILNGRKKWAQPQLAWYCPLSARFSRSYLLWSFWSASRLNSKRRLVSGIKIWMGCNFLSHFHYHIALILLLYNKLLASSLMYCILIRNQSSQNATRESRERRKKVMDAKRTNEQEKLWTSFMSPVHKLNSNHVRALLSRLEKLDAENFDAFRTRNKVCCCCVCVCNVTVSFATTYCHFAQREWVSETKWKSRA